MVALKIYNRDARNLWLANHGLARAPTGPLDIMAIIRDLGFVQLDTIRVVARAHDHIIWSRNQHYRESMLNRLLADERQLFEHYTHDASVIPMEFYPMWQRQFSRKKRRCDQSGWYDSMVDQQGRDAIKGRIAREGPLSTHAFDTKLAGERKMWSRPPHKLALDYMWYCGELATSHRQNFSKFYDLRERVIPAHVIKQVPNDRDQIDWLCSGALDRIGFGTTGDVQRFWEATTGKEVQDWADRRARDLIKVDVQAADRSWSLALAPKTIVDRVAALEPATSRLRILNPFDPVVRDRTRLKRLFGFDYRVEMFVPATKRRWGYYVFPLLEGDRFVGRIEAKADRPGSVLNVLNLWREPGVKWTGKRHGKLKAELERLARFVGLESVHWACGWPD